MNDQLRMCAAQTSLDSPSAISSLESADGATLCGSLAGPKTERPGPEAAHVSRSVSPASEKASTTNAIYGPSSRDSSKSENLQLCLENRLRQLLPGSPECEVIWKKWITPWGQSLSKPRAVVRRNIEIVFGLWPAVNVPNGGRSPKGGSLSMTGQTVDGKKRQVGLENAVKIVLSLYPSLTSNAKATSGYNEAGNSAGQVAIRKIILGLWPQSSARGWKGSKASPETLGRNSRPCNEVVFSVWSALRSTDGAKGGPNQSFGAGGSPLPSQVAKTAESSLSNVPMENFVGSLHPEFAGWEMGYPPEWLSCAPTAMPSSRKQQRSSSAPTSTLNPSETR